MENWPSLYFFKLTKCLSARGRSSRDSIWPRSVNLPWDSEDGLGGQRLRAVLVFFFGCEKVWSSCAPLCDVHARALKVLQHPHALDPMTLRHIHVNLQHHSQSCLARAPTVRGGAVVVLEDRLCCYTRICGDILPQQCNVASQRPSITPSPSTCSKLVSTSVV